MLGDRPGVIVDAYADGLWEATSSVTPRDTPFEAPVALAPGLHLVQVHTDPFSSARSATRFVATRGVSLDAALARLADLLSRGLCGRNSAYSSCDSVRHFDH